MTFRRGRDMHHVRTPFSKKLAQVAEMPFDAKSLVQLLRHQFFTVTNRHDFATLNPLDLRRVRVGDLSTSDYPNLKHGDWLPDRLRSTASGPRRWRRLATNRELFSPSR